MKKIRLYFFYNICLFLSWLASTLNPVCDFLEVDLGITIWWKKNSTLFSDFIFWLGSLKVPFISRMSKREYRAYRLLRRCVLKDYDYNFRMDVIEIVFYGSVLVIGLTLIQVLTK